MAVFLSVKELLSGAESAGLELWEYVLRASADETGISTEHSWEQMASRLEAMKKADASYDAGMRSHSGLTGGDGAKMDAYAIRQALQAFRRRAYKGAVCCIRLRRGDSTARLDIRGGSGLPSGDRHGGGNGRGGARLPPRRQRRADGKRGGNGAQEHDGLSM